jgi:release factor glutamine methyltransferase
MDDADIDSSVKQHEPHQALFAENQGLADIEQLLQQAKQFLKPKGLLIIEHGHKQQTAILDLAKQHAYKTTQGYNDLSGLNRYIVVQL